MEVLIDENDCFVLSEKITNFVNLEGLKYCPPFSLNLITVHIIKFIYVPIKKVLLYRWFDLIFF